MDSRGSNPDTVIKKSARLQCPILLESNDRAFETSLVRWDRAILNDWGLRSWIEWCGALIPAILEIAYSLLYAVLPLTIAGFYVRRERHMRSSRTPLHWSRASRFQGRIFRESRHRSGA